jgi:hypothetical protein
MGDGFDLLDSGQFQVQFKGEFWGGGDEMLGDVFVGVFDRQAGFGRAWSAGVEHGGQLPAENVSKCHGCQ